MCAARGAADRGKSGCVLLLLLRQKAMLRQHRIDAMGGETAHQLPTKAAGYGPRIGARLYREAPERGVVETWRLHDATIGDPSAGKPGKAYWRFSGGSVPT